MSSQQSPFHPLTLAIMCVFRQQKGMIRLEKSSGTHMNLGRIGSNLTKAVYIDVTDIICYFCSPCRNHPLSLCQLKSRWAIMRVPQQSQMPKQSKMPLLSLQLCYHPLKTLLGTHPMPLVPLVLKLEAEEKSICPLVTRTENVKMTISFWDILLVKNISMYLINTICLQIIN